LLLQTLQLALGIRQRHARPQPEKAAYRPAQYKSRAEQRSQQRGNTIFALCDQEVK